jgi:HSF-type DNA-binding
MPHGRSWKVLKPRIFETTVLPVFFESDNYHSFNRVINAWSFRRKSTGPDRGSYFHELFLRGKPHIQKYMRRLPRSHKKIAMKKEEEPDFFELAITSPLPSLEEAKSTVDLRKVQRLRNQLQLEAVHGAAQNSIYGLPTLVEGHGLSPHLFPPPASAFQPRGPL